MYYPKFWAKLIADPITKSLKLKIIETFGDENVIIDNILSEPAGKAASEGKSIAIDEVELKKGKVIDLSAYWDDIVVTKLENPILKNADSVPMRRVLLPLK